MQSGEWDKEQLDAEVQAHDDIREYSLDNNKLTNSRPEALRTTSATPTSTCIWNLEGNFYAIIGYPRHLDAPGRTHGWVSSVLDAKRRTASCSR